MDLAWIRQNIKSNIQHRGGTKYDCLPRDLKENTFDLNLMASSCLIEAVIKYT